jgi:hypothetical protein
MPFQEGKEEAWAVDEEVVGTEPRPSFGFLKSRDEITL